jgi:hypothetical protein
MEGNDMNIPAEKFPPDRAKLYFSLSRTAEILDLPVAEINRLQNDPAHGFPRRYSFDRDAEDAEPAKGARPARAARLAIKRGPFFRFDEIQRWKESAGDFGNCDRPPDKETAAPVSSRDSGNILQAGPNNYNAPAAHAQPTRDPGVRCRYFINGRGARHG